MMMYMICCTEAIENEVRQGLTQRAVALSYALALRSAAAGVDSPDWTRINRAILSRWKITGLERIKQRAWKIARGATP